jgi:hypothetical protein
LTADDLASCWLVGGHRPPLQCASVIEHAKVSRELDANQPPLERASHESLQRAH